MVFTNTFSIIHQYHEFFAFNKTFFRDGFYYRNVIFMGYLGSSGRCNRTFCRCKCRYCGKKKNLNNNQSSSSTYDFILYFCSPNENFHNLWNSTSLFICSVAVFLAFISVLFLPKIEVEKIKSKNYEEAFFKFFRRIIEGYTFIKDNKNILIPFFLLMVIQISGAIVTVNSPIIAREIFRININSAGVLLVVPAGIGAALSALIIPKLMKTRYRKKQIIEKSIMLIIFSSLLLIFLVPILE